MAALVIGHGELVARGDDGVLALITGDDRLDGFFHIALGDDLAVVLDGGNGGLVDDVRQFRAGAAARRAGDLRIIDVRLGLHVLGVYAQNRLASRQIGQLDGDSAVETTRTQQRLVQNFRAVGRRQNDDALARVKAVHLGEQLVERLLALVVAAHARVVAALADGVDFVDEDDARRFLARLLEQVAHARRAHADKHLHKFRAGNREERHLRLARDGLRQQRFARAGRADEQRALGQLRADIAVFLRIMQEIDDLLERVLGLVLAGHVVKRLAGLRLDVDLGVGFAEAHGVSAHALAHLAEHERAEAVENDQRQHPRDQERDDRAHFLRHNLTKFHARRQQALNQLVIRRHAVGGVIGSLAILNLLDRGESDLRIVNLDRFNLSIFEHRKKFGIINLLDTVSLNLREKQRVEQHHHDERDDVIDDQRPVGVFLLVHSIILSGTNASRFMMASSYNEDTQKSIQNGRTMQ